MNAPYVMRADYRLLRSSDAERVAQIENEFNEAVAAQQDDFDREYECWDAYMALNGGAWKKQHLAQLKEEDRHPWSFEVIGPKTDTLVGSLIAEMPDVGWMPVEGEPTSGSDAVTESYYSDKELANTDDHVYRFIRDGMVHIGWVQMVETMKYEKPVIGLQRVLPGRMVQSRFWLTDSDRDQKECYKVGYYIAEGMAHKWSKKHDAVMRAVHDSKKNGHSPTPTNAEEMRRRFDGAVGDEYKVIEYHWLEFVKTKRLVGMRIDPKTMRPSWVPFPVTKDRGMLERFAAANGVDWQTVWEDDYEDVIHHVTTICPDLDGSLILEDGKPKIQCKGLPFFHFTVTRYAGKNKGIVYSMLDPQRTINMRESLATELIDKANGGADLVDENIFKDPKQQEEFRKKKNKPGHTEFVDMSGITREPVYKMGANQYPSQLLDQVGRMYDRVIPLASRVSDSMSAITDSGKSGVLFEKEYQVNRIGNLLMDKAVKQFLNNWGEAYFYQYQITYAGEMREVKKRDGGTLLLNEPVALPNGGIGIRNAVEYTPRCKVIVVENKKSPTYQMRYRSMYSEVMQNINPEVNPEQWMFAFTKFMETLDLDDKSKGQLEMLNQMSMTRVQMKFIADVTGLHAATKQNELTAAQADQMLQQIMGAMRMQPQQVPQPAPEEQITAPSEMPVAEEDGSQRPDFGI